MKKALGEDHPNILTSMNNLAPTYWVQGRWKAAGELKIEVMETRKKVLGDKHSAYALMAECASISYWTLGPDHPDTIDRDNTAKDWKESDC